MAWKKFDNNKRRLLLYCLYIVLFVPGVQLSFIELDHERHWQTHVPPSEGGNGDKVNQKNELNSEQQANHQKQTERERTMEDITGAEIRRSISELSPDNLFLYHALIWSDWSTIENDETLLRQSKVVIYCLSHCQESFYNSQWSLP